MKIHVDYTRCTGHGFCEAADEEVFEVGADGVTHLVIENPGEEHRDSVAQAVRDCPTSALSLKD